LELIETEKSQRKEKVILVGVQFHQAKAWEVEDHLAELRLLAESAKAEVVEQIIVRRDAPTPALYIGKGKVEDLHEMVLSLDADTIIFDDDLSAAQQRNLEKAIEKKVIDRTELILDIFAQRAKTKEARIQIELAQIKYLLTRLTRMWTHLSKQYGGIGTKGPGETQLETDKRVLKKRIQMLNREIKEVRKTRATQRKARKRHNLRMAVLVGYTNAGKSTLLNALSDAGIEVSRKLFSTLDPTTRKIPLSGKRELLVSDTVGFIRKLPHNLVEAFMATLEEILEADVLIHVLDISDPLVEERAHAVYNVLEEIGFRDKPIITALNKVDLLPDRVVIERYQSSHPNCVVISAMCKQGLDNLIGTIESVFSQRCSIYILSIPQKDSHAISTIYETGNVLRKAYSDNRILMEAELDTEMAAKMERYIHILNKDEEALLFE
jgi:GTPase